MTAQIFERIIYDGERRVMATEPLAAWFEKSGTPPPFRELNTALWRGYIGTWEVVDHRLYLRAIEATLEDGGAATLADLFADQDGSAPVFASWFTGVLRLPKGKCVNYVHMGFASTFEENLMLDVEHGIVVSTELKRAHAPGSRWSRILSPLRKAARKALRRTEFISALAGQTLRRGGSPPARIAAVGSTAVPGPSFQV